MASIAGMVSRHGRIEIDGAQAVGKMLEDMRHRGPDNSNIRTIPDNRGAVGVNENRQSRKAPFFHGYRNGRCHG